MGMLDPLQQARAFLGIEVREQSPVVQPAVTRSMQEPDNVPRFALKVRAAAVGRGDANISMRRPKAEFRGPVRPPLASPAQIKKDS